MTRADSLEHYASAAMFHAVRLDPENAPDVRSASKAVLREQYSFAVGERRSSLSAA